jgi:hypothetical protein
MRKLGTTAVRISQGKMSCQGAIITNFALPIFPLRALAWNIPGHMLSGAIGYQIVQRENPSTIARVRSILENNPWYETRRKAQLDKELESDRNEMLFMLAGRWANDICTRDKAESRLPWHYVDFPFKPEASKHSGRRAATRKYHHSNGGEHADSTNREPWKTRYFSRLAISSHG